MEHDITMQLQMLCTWQPNVCHGIVACFTGPAGGLLANLIGCYVLQHHGWDEEKATRLQGMLAWMTKVLPAIFPRCSWRSSSRVASMTPRPVAYSLPKLPCRSSGLPELAQRSRVSKQASHQRKSLAAVKDL